MELSIQNWIVSSLDEMDQVRTIKEGGFNYCDWDLGPYFHKKDHIDESFDVTKQYYEKLKEQFDKYELNCYMTHATYPIDLKINKEKTLDLLERNFFATSILGAKYIVVHPMIPKKWDGEEFSEVRVKENIDFYDEITFLAKKYELIICIENLYGSLVGFGKHMENTCSNSKEMLDIINGVKEREYFGFCYDSGHSQLTTKEKHPEMLKEIINDVKVFHLHGNNSKFDLHLKPKKDNLNWDEVLKIINDSNYEGVLNFEILPIYTIGKNKAKKLQKLKNYIEEFIKECNY